MSAPWSRGTCLGGLIAMAAVLSGGAGIVRPASSEQEHPRHLPEDRAEAVMYVAIGDSTVYGIGANGAERNYVSRLYERLRSVYASARMTNLGVGGATGADVVERQLQRAVALRPDLVTLSIGPNDITRGRNVGEYERDIETIFRTLLRETTGVLVVNLIPDLTLTPRFRGREEAPKVGRRVALFNEALGRQARAHGVEVVDLFSASRHEVPQRPELIATDGYHPSDQGYARWAELMWQGVEARIRR
ncbi:MAG: GDSL-like protein lipase/acylhydrolase [Candidatus Rokubacteria bacterium CSP1-6]|nr:MAG: GDSL-like protein lipase/acylhydrolase [Candidatus Rokubacteria bacterium CSP1-6]